VAACAGFCYQGKTEGIALPLRFQDQQCNTHQQGAKAYVFFCRIYYIGKAIRQPEGDWLPRKKGG
jgi:hypothetical protein